MATFYTRIPGLGEVFAQFGGAAGRKWLDASLRGSEAQFWFGSSTLQVSLNVSPVLTRGVATIATFLTGLAVDLEASLAEGRVVFDDATIAILQQLGY